MFIYTKLQYLVPNNELTQFVGYVQKALIKYQSNVITSSNPSCPRSICTVTGSIIDKADSCSAPRTHENNSRRFKFNDKGLCDPGLYDTTLVLYK